MHRNIAWDKVENPNPQNTPQVPPSFEEATPPVTHPEEVDETIGTPIEIEPLNETKLEEVGLNCNHNTHLSSREVPSFDGPEPQPLFNSPSLDVSLGDVIGPEPPIKPHSLDSSRMKVVDYLTTQTLPSPHVVNSHPKGLEFKEVSPLGKELSLFDRPNKVERGRIPEAHRLKSILQQQISQHMAPSYHDDLSGGLPLIMDGCTLGLRKPAFVYIAVDMSRETPFKVLAKVGDVAYRLKLLQQLSRVHSTFHVSNLKKCLSDKPLAIPLDEIHIDNKLYFVEEPVEIMDREVKRLNQSRIPIIKVRWNFRRGPEFTWEREDQFKKKYLHLFTNRASSSNATS
ncbi:hypothetical protein Tco_0525314 [Tanacetum coccineum]